jgi:hypothetical protein
LMTLQAKKATNFAAALLNGLLEDAARQQNIQTDMLYPLLLICHAIAAAAAGGSSPAKCVAAAPSVHPCAAQPHSRSWRCSRGCGNTTTAHDSIR